MADEKPTAIIHVCRNGRAFKVIDTKKPYTVSNGRQIKGGFHIFRRNGLEWRISEVCASSKDVNSFLMAAEKLPKLHEGIVMAGRKRGIITVIQTSNLRFNPEKEQTPDNWPFCYRVKSLKNLIEPPVGKLLYKSELAACMKYDDINIVGQETEK